MRQKYNPWVSMVALVLLALILVFTCTGCTAQAEAAAPAPARFTDTRETTSYGFVHIITDNETGVQYISYKIGSGIGLTKLEG